MRDPVCIAQRKFQRLAMFLAFLIALGIFVCSALASTDYPSAIFQQAYRNHWYKSGNHALCWDRADQWRQWQLLGTFNFAAGTGGNVQITDGFSDAGQVVISDAIKFVYVP